MAAPFVAVGDFIPEIPLEKAQEFTAPPIVQVHTAAAVLEVSPDEIPTVVQSLRPESNVEFLS